jgi:protein TonB
MVVLSVGIHALIFVQIAELYQSESLTVIELTVNQEEPEARSIPRPRMRHKTPSARDVEEIDVTKPQVPRLKMDPVKTEAPDSIAEPIAAPDTSGLSAGIADWEPSAPATPDYLTRGGYFDMLRLKIESNKKYPEQARKRQIQGRVVVGFTLDESGAVTAARVTKSSRHPALDRAALAAVRSAAPFPRPPPDLFEGPLQMTITIVFELM